MHGYTPDFFATLKIFADARIDFIIVGGVCAVLHGAPVTTFDLDLVYSRKTQNLVRLETALEKLDAVYREKPKMSPNASLLDGPGHHLLMTRFGPLDLLGSTVGGRGFRDLLGHAESMDVGVGRQVYILDLPTLIQIKEALGSERDKAMLPILRRTLKEHGG